MSAGNLARSIPECPMTVNVDCSGAHPVLDLCFRVAQTVIAGRGGSSASQFSIQWNMQPRRRRAIEELEFSHIGDEKDLALDSIVSQQLIDAGRQEASNIMCLRMKTSAGTITSPFSELHWDQLEGNGTSEQQAVCRLARAFARERAYPRITIWFLCPISNTNLWLASCGHPFELFHKENPTSDPNCFRGLADMKGLPTIVKNGGLSFFACQKPGEEYKDLEKKRAALQDAKRAQSTMRSGEYSDDGFSESRKRMKHAGSIWTTMGSGHDANLAPAVAFSISPDRSISSENPLQRQHESRLNQREQSIDHFHRIERGLKFGENGKLSTPKGTSNREKGHQRPSTALSELGEINGADANSPVMIKQELEIDMNYGRLKGT